jgi:hypothetical protein
MGAMSELDRSSIARRIWENTIPAAGTSVEHYLRARAITLPVPDVLRFHPQFWHRSGYSASIKGYPGWAAGSAAAMRSLVLSAAVRSIRCASPMRRRARTLTTC